MASVLVTGASRGLGLEIVRQLAGMPQGTITKVLAVTRNTKSAELADLVNKSKGRVVNIVISDITSEKSIKEALPAIEHALDAGALDVLINNAGIMPFDEGVATMDGTSLMHVLNNNVASVQAMTSTLLPLIRKSNRKEVVNITSTLGSIGMAEQYSWASASAYKISKSTLNMLTKIWAIEHEKEGFTFLLISPGWLKTDLGSQNADLPVSVGAEQVIKITLSTDKSHSGRFRNILVPGYENVEGPNKYDGKDPVW